jgi:hypothetical protein
LVAEASPEPLDDLGGVVAAAVEALVDRLLDAPTVAALRAAMAEVRLPGSISQSVAGSQTR